MHPPVDTPALSPPSGCRRRLQTRRGPWGAMGIIALAVVAGLLSGCGGHSSATEATAAAATAVPGAEMRLHRGPFGERHLLTGEVVAREAIFLLAPNTNQWPVTIRWIVEDGTEVQAGEPVIEFDNSQLVSSLDDLSSRLAVAQNDLVLARSQAAEDLAQAWFAVQQQQAALDKARLQAQVPGDFISRQDAERRQLDLNKATLALEEAEERHAAQRLAGDKAVAVQQEAVDKARRAVERSEDDLRKLQLKAPRDGLVLVGRTRQGKIYQSSDNATPGMTVASMPDLSTLMVEARLFDVDDGKVQLGHRVRATLDAFPDEPLDGTVRSLGDYADQESSQSTRRSFKVGIEVEGMDPDRMRPGMSVSVALDLAPRQALQVPRRALSWSAEEIPSVQLADGSVVELTLGACNPSHCEVLDGPAEGTALRPPRGVSP